MFEIKTLILLNLIVSFSFGILQLLDLGWSKKMAARENILTNFLQFLGFSMVLLTPLFGVPWLIEIANIIILLSYIHLLITTFRLFNIHFSGLMFKISFIILFTLELIAIFMTNPFTLHTILLAVVTVLFFYASIRVFASLSFKRSKLAVVFIGLFTLFGSVYLLRFIYSVAENSSSFLDKALLSTIHLVSLTLFIFIWNYSVQLRRNSIVRKGIEENVQDLCDINEDVAILSSLFHQGDVRDMSELFSEIFDLIERRFAVRRILLYLFDKDWGALNIAACRGLNSSSEKYLIDSLDNDYSFIFDSFINQEIKSLSIEDLTFGSLKDILIEKGYYELKAFPLSYSGNCLGVLTLGVDEESSSLENQIFLSICKQLSAVIHNSQLYDELATTKNRLEELATIDHLTGIMNRREFLRLYESEFKKSQRHNDSFTLFIVDIDDFKKVNDTYGHDIGDKVLVSVVNRIKSSLRESDLFARYGGEEFIGILLKSDINGAYSKLEELVDSVSKIVIEDLPELRITISIGACNYFSDFEASNEIIKKADIALYKAKKSGKNRVVRSEVLSS